MRYRLGDRSRTAPGPGLSRRRKRVAPVRARSARWRNGAAGFQLPAGRDPLRAGSEHELQVAHAHSVLAFQLEPCRLDQLREIAHVYAAMSVEVGDDAAFLVRAVKVHGQQPAPRL